MAFGKANVDGGDACDTCHVADFANGFFGTGGGQSFEGQPQNTKIPHLRNAYAKVGMFGMFVEPDLTLGPATGPQVRGFGFLHDGAVDTVQNFLSAIVFDTTAIEEAQLEAFIFAFDYCVFLSLLTILVVPFRAQPGGRDLFKTALDSAVLSWLMISAVALVLEALETYG